MKRERERVGDGERESGRWREREWEMEREIGRWREREWEMERERVEDDEERESGG